MRETDQGHAHASRATYRRTGALWIGGGLLWLAAGGLGSGLRGWRFDSAQAVWIVADLLLLAGLLGLRRLGAHGQLRLGTVGLAIAIIGRLAFVAAELLCLVQQSDENAILPIAALLSASGMLAFGVAVLRAGVWTSPSRFGPLAAGLYPFLVMFPLVAANDGNPSVPAIAAWGLVGAVAIGLPALAAVAGSPSRATPPSTVLAG